ncbi:Gldg family protein [Sphingosinicella terrae]|uniref:Gldg family protein n=1 Tax=Sphingosinicella terrae TaxID=2172047 RepID=UPI000E0D5D3B|nr:hypothetical protein [Sphingosinicella terrae]
MSSRLRTEPSHLRGDPAALVAAACAFAAAELGAGLLLGGFFAQGRAEALLFLAFRPWLLLAAAAFASRLPWRRSLGFYLLALAVAGTAEALLLLALGGVPLAESVRGWGAGLAFVLIFDLLLRLARRIAGRWAAAAMAIGLVVLLLIVPGSLRPYERLVIGDTAPVAAADRPRLLLMTGLPLIWGEAGPFAPDSRPAAAYVQLQQEFAIRPIDHVDEAALAGERLMLLAQPRGPEPRELVALDRWVAEGGRVLVLADTELAWPSRLPPGDSRRPPSATGLAPLLRHWGLRLDRSAPRSIRSERVADGDRTRRLVLHSPGRFTALDEACRVGPEDWLARCGIGKGEAWIVADADLLRDDLWVGPGPRGPERHGRSADNPILVAAWLDSLAGLERERTALPVHWQDPEASPGLALLLASFPVAAGLGLAGILRRRRRL